MEKVFFYVNESDEMAFRSISINLSIVYVGYNITKLISNQLNHA